MAFFVGRALEFRTTAVAGYFELGSAAVLVCIASGDVSPTLVAVEVELR